ncbi:hypothetical protein B0H10DRAFT_680483 [Mycena sp. CBHHK59/15]|nr:hypothetical protein B0H10DRAFT_680483 [Mycena sp. CBHHK59/15]
MFRIATVQHVHCAAEYCNTFGEVKTSGPRASHRPGTRSSPRAPRASTTPTYQGPRDCSTTNPSVTNPKPISALHTTCFKPHACALFGDIISPINLPSHVVFLKPPHSLCLPLVVADEIAQTFSASWRAFSDDVPHSLALSPNGFIFPCFLAGHEDHGTFNNKCLSLLSQVQNFNAMDSDKRSPARAAFNYCGVFIDRLYNVPEIISPHPGVALRRCTTVRQSDSRIALSHACAPLFVLGRRYTCREFRFAYPLHCFTACHVSYVFDI